MKSNSTCCALILLAMLCACDLTSCSKKPADATKQLITELFDNCKNGKNAEAAALLSNLMPEKEKQRMKKDRIDYSLPEDKSRVDGMCRQLNSEYGEGYDFGKFESQPKPDGSAVVVWEVFPKNKNEGQVLAFTLENGKYVLLDIDPARR